MRYEIRTIVDLGDCTTSTEAEQLLDVETLCRAVGEAVIWHGAVVTVRAYREIDRTTVFALEATRMHVVPDTYGGLELADVDGVEWGGR